MNGNEPIRRETTAMTTVTASVPKMRTWLRCTQKSNRGSSIQPGTTACHQMMASAITATSESISAIRFSCRVMPRGQQVCSSAYPATGSASSSGTDSTLLSKVPASPAVSRYPIA